MPALGTFTNSGYSHNPFLNPTRSYTTYSFLSPEENISQLPLTIWEICHNAYDVVSTAAQYKNANIARQRTRQVNTVTLGAAWHLDCQSFNVS